MDSIFQALSYPFFVRSLFVVILISICFPLYGNIIILRKQANIAHAFAHMGLLGIAVGVFFDLPLDLTIYGSISMTVFILYVLHNRDKESADATNEIIAQCGLVGAILVVSQMTGYRSDLSAYLFGDILLIGQSDVIVISIVISLLLCMYVIFQKKRFAFSLNSELAQTRYGASQFSNICYILMLGLLVGAAMKIIGVLLVSAFLILPSNISKLLTTTKKQWIIVGISLSLVISVFAMFLSWSQNMPAGATIVALFILIYIVINILLGKK